VSPYKLSAQIVLFNHRSLLWASQFTPLEVLFPEKVEFKNVTGKLFYPLHEQFEEQYTELADAVDVIAERIRALGFRAPGTFKEYRELTSIKEDDDQPDAMEMVRRLALSNEQVLYTVREALKLAQKGEDEATIDLLTQRLNTHSKTAWMLRSHLV
jgi:starvation-inducible DNA-binding protein